MSVRKNRSEPPAWTRPGSRWVPWLCWPALCLSAAVLVWRVMDGRGAGAVIVSALLCLTLVGVLISHRAHRRRRHP
ncbi:hypothetical protein [Streptomyces sp. NPDC055060]